ncbi:MAG: TIGR04283 family arsenosugar biosynthesis glycosyltransferase [Candidatus Omnitrophica bacterium]|nr:TIGR04283 family arsenosugar biosynthesis glycosyltransferase [Candidatus Omnitrophota bacterium]
MKVSIIIPTYNEENSIESTLGPLIGENGCEVIVVDGYSKDRTKEIVRSYPVIFKQAGKNRANQLNAGAGIAGGDVLVFLHADCILEKGGLPAIINSVKKGFIGGCSSQRINSSALIYRFIEASGNIRAKLSHIFYGDQAIFVRRDIFQKIGGFDDVALFEDIIFSRKLKKYGKTCTLKNKIFTSARRWEKQGIIKTTLINWLVSIGFFFGIAPHILKKIYSEVR